MARLTIVASLLLLMKLQETIATGSIGTIQVGVLGEDSVELRPAKMLSLNGRRLNLATAPASQFKVVACSAIAGLSEGKKAILQAKSITRCIDVFNALVAGHSGVSACGAENNMLYMANVLAELLDVDLKGAVTDPKVAKYLQNVGDAAANPFLLAGCKQAEEEFQDDSATMGGSYSSQGWKSSGPAADTTAILIEETFHMVHQKAWAKVYDPFADTWTSDLGKCLKEAQCTWFQHPENAGCSGMTGGQCANDEVACTGACASYNVPGQCFETEENCARADCDIPEFFHKMFLIVLDDPSLVANPAHSFYPYMMAKGVNTAAVVREKMAGSTSCQALLAEFSDTKYALPRRKLTGTYTVVTTTAAATVVTTTAAATVVTTTAAATAGTTTVAGTTAVGTTTAGDSVAGSTVMTTTAAGSAGTTGAPKGGTTGASTGGTTAKAVAKVTTTKAVSKDLVLTGGFKVNVADVDAFMKDTVAVKAVTEGIAKAIGADSNYVKVTLTKVGRRLDSKEVEMRRLAGGAVQVDYVVTIPASASATQKAISDKASALTTDTLTTEVQAKVTAAKGADYKVTVTEITSTVIDKSVTGTTTAKTGTTTTSHAIAVTSKTRALLLCILAVLGYAC